jgi:hypothetical protein
VRGSRGVELLVVVVVVLLGDRKQRKGETMQVATNTDAMVRLAD